MQRRVNQAIFAVLTMTTFWLVIHTVKLNTIVPDYKLLNRTVNVLMDRVLKAEKYIDKVKAIKDKISYEDIYKSQIESFESFAERFNRMRAEYGSGAVFDWDGRLFTTYYAEEITNNN